MQNNKNLAETLKKPQFDALSPERKEMFLSLVDKLQGKSNMEAVVIITDFMKRMPKDKELTRAEQEAMTEAFLETMPESDRARFNSVINMIKVTQKK